MRVLTRLSIVLFFPIIVNASPQLYAPTGDANDLVVIDLKTDTIVNRIADLKNAHGLAPIANSQYLIAGSMQPTIVASNGKGSNIMAKPANVSEDEHAAHHAGETNKSAAPSPSYVSIVDTAKAEVVSRIAVAGLTHHTAASPDGKIAIAVHSGVGGISVIDLEKMKVLNVVKTGRWPNFAVFNDNGKRLYISNAGSGSVSEIDTRSWKVIRDYKVGKEPEHLVLSKDNKILFASNKGDGTISALDLNKGRVTNVYPVGKSAHGLDLSDDGKWLFSTSKGNNTLTRIDLSSHKLKKVELAPAPYHLAFIEGMNKLYVSSRKNPKIWVVDPSSLTVVNEINLGKGFAHQMVIREN